MRAISPKRLRDTLYLCIMSTILLIILILLLIGALPAWPYSRGWGYYPTGGLGLILVIVIILALLGTI
jgi:sterol desaturase/sphingolipid hydroxylase (fatty acid hydroxylase superfamily)